MEKTEKEKIIEALKKCYQDKGKRNFLQSVELVINFKDVDFSKEGSRVNITLVLPKGRGKEKKILVFAEDPIASEAKKLGVNLVLKGNEISKLSKDKIKKMIKDWEFLVEPKLMATFGKEFGQVLGSRGKLPSPIIGKLDQLIKNSKDHVTIRSRGKYLPTLSCPVGTEEMKIEDVAENIETVIDSIKSKVTGKISSIYVKLSMGKPNKIE